MMAPDQRPRILLADADAARRAAARSVLGDDFTLAEALRAEEVLAWLDDADPGLTLLEHALPGSGGAELVARIHELFPDEIVLVVAPEPSVGFCRAAMRAGAYDCLDRDGLHPEQMRALCESAANRLSEGARARAARAAGVRTTVRAHEREAASRLCSPTALAAWRATDIAERTHWLELWDRALQSIDTPAERSQALEDVVEAVIRHPRAAELLPALHLHAVSGVRPPGREDALERARELLVETLQLLAQHLAQQLAQQQAQPQAPRASASQAGAGTVDGAQAPAPTPAPSPPPGQDPAAASAPALPEPQATPGPEPEPRLLAAALHPAAAAVGVHGPRRDDIPDLLWHRWCLADGNEEWTLVGEGRPLARVSVVADGCRAYIRDQQNGGRVTAAMLPPVPNGLREVERRLGLPPVLTVRSASVVA